MGFNYEQYELNNNDSYNEFLGIGSGKVKKALGIGDGKILGVVVNPTKNAEYEANKAIISGDIAEPYVAPTPKPLDVVEDAKAKADAKKIAEDKAKQDAIIVQGEDQKNDVKVNPTDDKNKTMLYAGIGAGVLILATIITIIIIKKNKDGI